MDAGSTKLIDLLGAKPAGNNTPGFSAKIAGGMPWPGESQQASVFNNVMQGIDQAAATIVNPKTENKPDSSISALLLNENPELDSHAEIFSQLNSAPIIEGQTLASELTLMAYKNAGAGPVDNGMELPPSGTNDGQPLLALTSFAEVKLADLGNAFASQDSTVAQQKYVLPPGNALQANEKPSMASQPPQTIFVDNRTRLASPGHPIAQGLLAEQLSERRAFAQQLAPINQVTKPIGPILAAEDADIAKQGIERAAQRKASGAVLVAEFAASLKSESKNLLPGNIKASFELALQARPLTSLAIQTASNALDFAAPDVAAVNPQSRTTQLALASVVNTASSQGGQWFSPDNAAFDSVTPDSVTPTNRGLSFDAGLDFSSQTKWTIAANVAESFQTRLTTAGSQATQVPLELSSVFANTELTRIAKTPIQQASLDIFDVDSVDTDTSLSRQSTGLSTAVGNNKVDGLSQSLPTGPTSLQTRSPLTSNAWAGEFSQQIGVMVSKNLEQAQIQIDPPELGPIQIRMHLDNDQLSLQITTAHLQVKDAIEQTLGRLQQQLEGQGFNLTGADVSHGDPQSQHGQRNAGDGDSQDGVNTATTATDADILTLPCAASVNNTNIDTFA